MILLAIDITLCEQKESTTELGNSEANSEVSFKFEHDYPTFIFFNFCFNKKSQLCIKQEEGLKVEQ